MKDCRLRSPTRSYCRPSYRRYRIPVPLLFTPAHPLSLVSKSRQLIIKQCQMGLIDLTLFERSCIARSLSVTPSKLSGSFSRSVYAGIHRNRLAILEEQEADWFNRGIGVVSLQITGIIAHFRESRNRTGNTFHTSARKHVYALEFGTSQTRSGAV